MLLHICAYPAQEIHMIWMSMFYPYQTRLYGMLKVECGSFCGASSGVPGLFRFWVPTFSFSLTFVLGLIKVPNIIDCKEY